MLSRTDHRAVVRTFPAEWVSRQSLRVFREALCWLDANPGPVGKLCPHLHEEVTPSQAHRVKQAGTKPQAVTRFGLW